MEGIIFDKQRFALNDGPGIRTVIFLKGCPLNCKWCSNPESIKPKPQLSFSAKKCEDAGNCFAVCPEDVFSGGFPKQRIDFEKCTNCGKCVENCPTGALKILGYVADSDELIREVLRDMEYYKNSGGGLTLSGGEPLFQFDFAFDILTKAKQADIHTCIETTGFVNPEKMIKILPVTDVFLYDYKITNEPDHQFYTGVSNQKIIENLHLILNSGGKVVLRCVIIPGVNDNEKHFRTVADLSQHKNVEKVEILPYHEYGKHKYKQTGRRVYEFNMKTLPEHPDIWIEKIRELGCSKISVG